MRCYYGVDVGGTAVKTAVLNEDGVIIAKREFPTEAERGFEDLAQRLSRILDELRQEAGLTVEDVCGVGVGVPAFLDGDVIREAVNLGWHNVPLRQYLEDALHKPVRVDNDANVAGLGEAWKGAGAGARTALCVTVGTGIGAGIVIDGKIYRGVNGSAGEIGHMVVRPGGRLCNCGNHGCLETLASASALVREAKRLQSVGELPDDLEIDGAQPIFALAEAGNKVAAGIIWDAGHWLGYGLASTASVLNPDVIVVGGGVSKAGEELLRPVRAAFVEYSASRVHEAVEIRLASLGNDAGVVGAARLAAQAFG
ncbi:ROK family protein [Alicyclobacillus shizuokensis]|uniref:ROK family protein n=1 Tax=Alicyclobacillus shizuokensis TaxID=392014 RepID=UPI000830F0BB|nr:ROK family protein [Alicyclobacillus shizuokensis]